MKLTKHENNPILSPLESSEWQSLVVTNPACIYDEERQKFIMLYRAAGKDIEHRVYLGLAESDNGIDFTRVSEEPVFGPSFDAYDAGCVEDPRMMKIGDWYYVTYASRPYAPGQYWLMDGNPYKPEDRPDDFPVKYRESLTTTSLAVTKDFKKWYRCGPLTDPRYDDRDVYFFPEKVNGKWWMIHRPMEWCGEGYPCEHPGMWINSSDDLLHWDSNTSKFLAGAEYDWEQKIGGNTPPIKTEHGWMTIYHAKGEDGYYRLGALLLDLENPAKVTHRSRDWFLEPEFSYETEGCYDMGGVCFPCGAVVKDGTLFVYYGGADMYVGVATGNMDDFMAYLLSCPT
jgi:predicted GH43/DUF377 family glycosyl hydrolase